VSFEEAAFQWETGERRVAEAPRPLQPALERVVGAIQAELRRRLGGRFTTEELVDYYYANGTDWCLQIATRVAPEDPSAWDVAAVADAAFARYVREAADYAGGRRIPT
jgi:hypothetical protein